MGPFSYKVLISKMGFLGTTSDKESPCQRRRFKRHRFDPWVGKIRWRREWQPTPAFLPREFNEQRQIIVHDVLMLVTLAVLAMVEFILSLISK